MPTANQHHSIRRSGKSGMDSHPPPPPNFLANHDRHSLWRTFLVPKGSLIFTKIVVNAKGTVLGGSGKVSTLTNLVLHSVDHLFLWDDAIKRGTLPITRLVFFHKTKSQRPKHYFIPLESQWWWDCLGGRLGRRVRGSEKIFSLASTDSHT